jgi:hypothetical protein
MSAGGRTMWGRVEHRDRGTRHNAGTGTAGLQQPTARSAEKHYTRWSGLSPCSGSRPGSASRPATWPASARYSTYRGLSAATGRSWRSAKRRSNRHSLNRVRAISSSGRATEPCLSGPAPYRKAARSEAASGSAQQSGSCQERHPLASGAKPLFEAGRLSWRGKYLKPAKKTARRPGSHPGRVGQGYRLCERALPGAGSQGPSRGHRAQFGAISQGKGRRARESRRQENHHQRPVVTDALHGGLHRDRGDRPHHRRDVRGSGGPLRERRVRSADRLRSQATRPVRATTMAGRAHTTSRPGDFASRPTRPTRAPDWTQQWRETPNRALSDSIPAIVRELEKATVEIARLVEEGDRQAEIERKRWEAQYENNGGAKRRRGGPRRR